ncbi:MAG: hypothetical protein ACJAT2_001902 [Bacteriovoracaceae bacterium]|jgi:hypothetical protein
MVKALYLLPFLFIAACNERGPSSVDGEKFKNSSDFLLKRVAFKFSGTFQGIKEKGKARKFKVTECNFSYEKGQDEEHKTEKEYQFERFTVSFEGIDTNGVSSYDSVSYTNSNYLKSYVPFDYSNSFGPVPLNSVIKLGTQEKDASLKFVRGAGKSAVMQFKHTDKFGAERSKFYDYGEIRNYTVRIYFDEYGKNISLDKVSVAIESKKMNKFGGHEKAIPIAEIKCSQFKSLPDM